MGMTDRQWRRDTKRLPKWKALVLAKKEYTQRMIAKYDKVIK
jgi:hypothetical protein